MDGRFFVVFLLLHIAHATIPQAVPNPPGKKWQTLNGMEPVLATTGVSGVFPEGTDYGFNFDKKVSYLPNTLYYCDLQLTKDELPLCMSTVTLENSTNIKDKIPNGKRRHNVNGLDVEGWFALDFTFYQLFEDNKTPISLVQRTFSRTSFVDEMYGLSALDTDDKSMDDATYWINVEHDLFYKQFKLNPETFILNFLNVKPIVYLSSPEVNFLKGMVPKLLNRKTKLIFKFQPSLDVIEPTTKEPYGSWLKKLSEIKLFAAGILVPKEFIWPVHQNGYLLPASTLVNDAHKLGLEVHVYGLQNDARLSFNYSYDPIKEYLNYVDNSQFSVDGIVTDFPVTASESIKCFAHEKDLTKKVPKYIISHNGASGDFPGSTDLAYQKAIDDGADIIDCSVQLSKDGVAFCMDSADLTFPTNAAETFMEKSQMIPEMGPSNGVYSFDLTWTEIQSLKPQLRSNYDDKQLPRNPLNKAAGKFVTLPEFLNLAKTRKVHGVMITVNNVPYLASKRGLDMIKTASTALTEAGLDKQQIQKVLIQSDDSAVLEHFKETAPSYQRVFETKEDLMGVSPEVPAEIKKFADAITLQRNAIVLNYPMPMYLSANYTNIVAEMHKANVSVYVGVFKNEFTNLLFDYYADPYIELATHDNAEVDGFITDFPSTAAAYMRSWCSSANNNYNISGINPGDVFSEMKSFRDELKLDAGDGKKEIVPPVKAPILTKENVVDPPLPPVAVIPPPPASPERANNQGPNNGSASAATFVDASSSKACFLVSMIVGAICLQNVM
ncbi:phosphodiesterase [Lithospermum erythrorhizon]|uniref:glycerophosphodiester phosphodiesterase n=1 Tax=Lithospermum erythrorhizon TaxID=34254 RepID=A0AAV3Q9R5_LITER